MLTAVRAEGLRRTYGRDAVGLAFAAVLALIAGAVVVRSTQAGLTLALLVLLVCVRAQSRSASLAMMWSYWLLAPMLRRILDVTVGPASPDPLSLLPFLATAVLAAIELRATHLNRRARRILILAGTGFLIGAPIGLFTSPSPAIFAAVAYCAGLSAFVLGWGDGSRRGAEVSLRQILAVVLPVLAVYGILQYFLPLISWDAHWVATAPLKSIGSPQKGHIRVFASVNAPFTFAIVLGTGILLGLGWRHRFGMGAVTTLIAAVALALTFMRSVWLGLVLALIVFAASVRGRAAGRVVAVIAVCLVGLVAVGGSNPTTKAFTERITSLGSPESDVSAQERLGTTNRLLPVAVSQPLGAGLGQAGLAAELSNSNSAESTLVTVDDGYLSLMYQVGPFGFALVLAAIVLSVGSAMRALSQSTTPSDRQSRAAVLATLVMLLVVLAAGDVFFGLPGVILWYLCGLCVALVASADVREDDLDTPSIPLRYPPERLLQSRVPLSLSAPEPPA